MTSEVYPNQDEADPGARVSRWGDEAMYLATPLTEADGKLEPRVTMISMTYNPLRVMAAAAQQYRGIPVHDPREIDQETALEWLASGSENRLKAPLEFIDLHLYFEGVSRAFTHQLVRQRTAVYVQESMRFAVKNHARSEIVEPPSLAGLPEDHAWRAVWDGAVARIDWAYNSLVESGMPAEDARGLLPTNIGTRIHYKTNLRNLAEQSMNRLCSQAQDEWKEVWRLIIEAILGYGPESERWQQRAIVKLFKPICYQSGHCEFMAPTDRYCSIRDRVQAHAERGDRPEIWLDIDPREPLHRNAARRPQ